MAKSFGQVITSKQANSTAKALIQAISTRNPKSPANGAGELSLVNKADEVGEVAAYFFAAIESNAGFATSFGTPKSAAKFVFKVVKTMFKAAKIKALKASGQTSKDLQTALLAKGGNFAASITYTLTKLGLSAETLAAIQAKLVAGSKSIAGKANAATLALQFDAGFVATDAQQFEDGTLGNMIDPETDIRNG